VATTPSMYLQSEGFSQAKQRRTGTIFRDQHNRRYHAVIELKTGHPTGMIEPQFQAPLMPEQKYLKVGTNPERPYDLRIDYEAWLADLRTAHREYETQARQLARKMYREKYNAQDFLTEEVLDVIGPPPQHVEVVLAARQGNKYVLGLTDRVDIRLAAMLEEDKPRFADIRTMEDEGDFSDVVEALDEGTANALEADTQRRRDQARERDRERKRRQRAARRDAELPPAA
jgi:hypothetical protein